MKNMPLPANSVVIHDLISSTNVVLDKANAQMAYLCIENPTALVLNCSHFTL